MPWSDDTRCLFCNGKLPLYRRLKQGQFCSQAHHQEYEAQQEQLGLERLFETHSNLQAARPKVSAESILGPEPVVAKRPEFQPVIAPEPRPSRPRKRDRAATEPESIEIFARPNEPAAAVLRESNSTAPAGPRGPEEGSCHHCGKKLPLFQKLKHGQFCSKAHQAEFAKAQDLLGLERLFETHSNLQALRPSAGAESILGPVPAAAQAPSPVATERAQPPLPSGPSRLELVPAAVSESATAGVPGYATKLQQRPPNSIALPHAMVAVDPLHYEATPQPQNARLNSDFETDRTAAAVLTPSFAERVHVDLGGRLGLDPATERKRADVVESLSTLGRNMRPTALQATVTPFEAEPFTGTIAIAGYSPDPAVTLTPSFAERVEVLGIGVGSVEPSDNGGLAAGRLTSETAEAFVGSIAFATEAGSLRSSQPAPRSAALLPVPAQTNRVPLTGTAAIAGTEPLDWPEPAGRRIALSLNSALRIDSGTIALLAPPRVAASQKVAVRLVDAADTSAMRPVLIDFVQDSAGAAVALLPTSDTNPVSSPKVLGAPSLERLVSLAWRLTGSGLAKLAPSGVEVNDWAVTPTTDGRMVPPMPVALGGPAVRDTLSCLPLPFAAARESSMPEGLGLIGAQDPEPSAPTTHQDRKLELAGDAVYSLLAQVCSPSEKLLRLPEWQLQLASTPITPRWSADGYLEFQSRVSQAPVKPCSVPTDRFELPSLAPPPGGIVELPFGKGQAVAVLAQPAEAIDIEPLSKVQLASSLQRVAANLGSLKPRKNATRSCKLLQPMMVLFRLAYLKNTRPIEYVSRVQGNVLPESEPGQAILPVFRARPESSLGISMEHASASPMMFAARPAVGAVSAWTGFWHNAPRDLKILLVAIPLLAALAFSPGIPKVSLHSQEGDGISGRLEKAVSFQLASLRKTVLERAAVALDEDFRQGLDEWVGKGGATTEWSFDETGFVRPGPLALYRPSRGLTDYKMEFLGLIDNKALSWVVRAADFQNYYVIKLMVVKAGQVPELQLTRYAVIDGKPEDRKDTPVYLRGRGDLPYRISVNLEGDKFSVYVQNLLMDSWNEPRLMRGGVGFFTAHGEQSRVRWVQVTHQYDTLGRLCAFLAPSEFSNNPEER